MPIEPPAGSRNMLLAIALVGVVAACGAAGMFFSKEVSHAATVTPSAPPNPSSLRARTKSAPRTPLSEVGPTSPNVTAPSLAAHHSASLAPSTPDGSGAAPVSSAETTPSGETPGEVTDDKEANLALERWQKAMLTNDSAEIAPSYARRVNRFFLRTQVSREFVRDYLERDEERGTRLTRYDMQNVTMKHIKPDEIEVDFRASFAVSTPETDRAGDTRTTLMLRREEGDWKIVYERDFKS